VTLTGTLLLRGLSPDSFELGFVGQGLRLRYPEGLGATLDADLRMSGTSESQILSGRIDVSEATWSREYDLATGILVSRDTEGLGLLEEIDGETFLNNLRLDVAVTAPGTLRIRNSRATVDARAELQLRGTFAHPALLGRTEALRGELFLLGQRYRLLTGRVEFLDPSTIKPFFDLVAESRVRSYRVELRITGTPDRFFPELSSDPPLRTVDILRLLSGASERDILIGSEEEEIAGVGVASLLTERLSQEVGRRAERLFGLDRFSIDPFLVGQFANPTARVSIGKQIYRDLSVSYSTNLNAATETLILIEYSPEGPITWIISRDEEGAYGVDLRFRKSF
jgi:translocation and assembly module TamB